MKRNWMVMAMAAFLAMAWGVQAQGLDAVKKSMLERKPALEQLLAAKTVGENNAVGPCPFGRDRILVRSPHSLS